MKYSNSFNFFFQHQIGVLTEGNGKVTKFFSLIKHQLFKTINSSNRLTPNEIKEHCFKIHKKLIKEQNNPRLFSSDYVLFNEKTNRVARYTDQQGNGNDIILFSSKLSAEQNQEPGEEIISCLELPLDVREELILQTA